MALRLIGLAGCSPDEPIRIGFIGGLSGRGADLGESGRHGAMLAIEERRERSGAGGHPIALLVRDDRQDPDTARETMRELIEAGVVAVVGLMTSTMVAAVLPIANEAGIVVVSPTATAMEFSGKEEHFFRINGTTHDNAVADDATTMLIAALEHRGSACVREAMGRLGEVQLLQQTAYVDRIGDLSRKRRFATITANQFVVE